MQSLCTLRDHCRQWPRNTRYQADATPYLGRTFTGWIAPACGWRTHSITSSARASSVGGTSRPKGFRCCVDQPTNQLEPAGPLHGRVACPGALENPNSSGCSCLTDRALCLLWNSEEPPDATMPASSFAATACYSCPCPLSPPPRSVENGMWQHQHPFGAQRPALAAGWLVASLTAGLSPTGSCNASLPEPDSSANPEPCGSLSSAASLDGVSHARAGARR